VRDLEDTKQEKKEEKQLKVHKKFDLHNSEELRSKKLSELTIGEFVDLLPLMKRTYRRKFVDSEVTNSRIESFLQNSTKPYSMYQLAKELKVSYDTIRYHVAQLEEQKKVVTNEVTNKSNRVEKQVLWMVNG